VKFTNLEFDLVNNIFNNVKNKNLVKDFIMELQNHLENSMSKSNYVNIEKEDISLVNSIHNGNKIIAKYRDKMNIERSNILNSYSKKTLDKGEMYYIYSKNSRIEEFYNLCICEEGKSHIVIEENRSKLPSGVEIGSVLRKNGDVYVLDSEATKELEEEIYKMEEMLLEKQIEFLNNKRIEGHIYEIAENGGDRAWLFDITNNSNEGVEEIDFPIGLLQEAKEGDKFIYKNGEYKEY